MSDRQYARHRIKRCLNPGRRGTIATQSRQEPTTCVVVCQSHSTEGNHVDVRNQPRMKTEMNFQSGVSIKRV